MAKNFDLGTLRRAGSFILKLALAVPLACVGLLIYSIVLVLSLDPGGFGRTDENLALALEEAVAPTPRLWTEPIRVTHRIEIFAETADQERFWNMMYALRQEIAFVSQVPIRSSRDVAARTTVPTGVFLVRVVGSTWEQDFSLDTISASYSEYGGDRCRYRFQHQTDGPGIERAIIAFVASRDEADWPERAIGCATRALFGAFGLVGDTCRLRPSVLCAAHSVRRPTFGDLILLRAQTRGPSRHLPTPFSTDARVELVQWLGNTRNRESRPADWFRRAIWLREYFGNWTAARGGRSFRASETDGVSPDRP